MKNFEKYIEKMYEGLNKSADKEEFLVEFITNDAHHLSRAKRKKLISLAVHRTEDIDLRNNPQLLLYFKANDK